MRFFKHERNTVTVSCFFIHINIYMKMKYYLTLLYSACEICSAKLYVLVNCVNVSKRTFFGSSFKAAAQSINRLSVVEY